MESCAVACGFQMRVHNIRIHRAKRFNAPEMTKRPVLLCPTSSGMRPVVAAKELFRTPLVCVEGACRPQDMDVGLFPPISRTGTVKGPDIGMDVTERGLEKIAGCSHLLPA